MTSYQTQQPTMPFSEDFSLKLTTQISGIQASTSGKALANAESFIGIYPHAVVGDLGLKVKLNATFGKGDSRIFVIAQVDGKLKFLWFDPKTLSLKDSFLVTNITKVTHLGPKLLITAKEYGQVQIVLNSPSLSSRFFENLTGHLPKPSVTEHLTSRQPDVFVNASYRPDMTTSATNFSQPNVDIRRVHSNPFISRKSDSPQVSFMTPKPNNPFAQNQAQSEKHVAVTYC